MKKTEVITKIERAVGRGRGVALSNDELIELADLINTNAAAAKAHADMLHALIENSPAHVSYALH